MLGIRRAVDTGSSWPVSMTDRWCCSNWGGYNTPSIIKFPFERITAQYSNVTLIRVNRDYPEVSEVNHAKTIAFDQDIQEIVAMLLTE